MNTIRYIFLSLLLLISLARGAFAVEFNQLVPSKSTLSFSYKQMGASMEGQFRQFTADISFDPAKTHTAQAQLTVALASLDSGVSEADQEVAGKQWFNTKIFPTAHFVSTGVKALGGNRYEALGKLTIKGKSMDVSAPFTFKLEGASGVFDGTFILKRLDYAIGDGPWRDVSAVANEIQVKFHLVAVAASRKK